MTYYQRGAFLCFFIFLAIRNSEGSFANLEFQKSDTSVTDSYKRVIKENTKSNKKTNKTLTIISKLIFSLCLQNMLCSWLEADNFYFISPLITIPATIIFSLIFIFVVAPIVKN
jgi:uncharacterized protein YacL